MKAEIQTNSYKSVFIAHLNIYNAKTRHVTQFSFTYGALRCIVYIAMKLGFFMGSFENWLFFSKNVMNWSVVKDIELHYVLISTNTRCVYFYRMKYLNLIV